MGHALGSLRRGQTVWVPGPSRITASPSEKPRCMLPPSNSEGIPVPGDSYSYRVFRRGFDDRVGVSTTTWSQLRGRCQRLRSAPCEPLEVVDTDWRRCYFRSRRSGGGQ